MNLVLILGLLMTAITVALAAHRVWFLFRLAMTGQPAPDRVENVTKRLGTAIRTEVVEVFGQKKLLKWSVPGAAHFFVFWAFMILLTVYIEAYAILISRDPEWHWWILGSWGPLGFLQDFIAFMCFVGIVVFWFIRMRNAPEKLGRESRFQGSHTTGAYFVLFMIFNVLWTLFLFRAAVEARDSATGYGGGYGWSAFISHTIGTVLPNSTWLIGIGLLLHIGVMLVFLIDVLHSKHLHIFVAPLNVVFGRRPVALGAIKPLMSDGKPVSLDDVEEMDEDTKLGVGSIEDFSWKGMLDFYSCTECGRCQSQCPAWNTEKPLSPKLLIMGLRDHAMQKAPYLLADPEDRASLPDAVTALAERPLVGEAIGGDYNPPEGAVIADDVLWSCTSCGACVNQCPVDIEHVDHIMDMRRYQVLVESNFPSELNGLFRGLENKGNPWNLSPTSRMEWAQGLDFDVRVLGEDVESMDDVDWLFWVGCAGAYEDRAKKTTRAVAELFHLAGVDFAVLGNGETCTGDPARRAGNEFVFQGLAQQNAETFKEMKVKKVVSTCAHCFNTLKNEYADFGVELEVVHHTQLLNRLVREKKLTPVAVPGGNAAGRSITYHDPCYLGRHNQVYSPPRELLQIIPDATFTEMPRNSERSFCCGAGGARMWMEETIGERINVNRTQEAVATGADQIAVGCPFCRVMLEDGLTAEQSEGRAREEVEVLDVAQLLLASVKGEAPKAKATTPAGAATAARPAAADPTQTAATVTATQDVGPAAKASGGGSLFDTPATEAKPSAEAPTEPAATQAQATTEARRGGGSLFDLGPQESQEARPAGPAADQPTESRESTESTAAQEPAQAPAQKPAETKPADGLGGGSLFDIAAPTTPAKAAEAPAQPADAEETAPAPAQPAAAAPQPASNLGSGSLFDLPAPEAAAPKSAPEPTEAEEPTAEQAEAEQAEAEQPKKGESHQPKTDADINQAGSLFDL
ncbi:(Fe-S)-binding protein [Nocardioides terrisoli]|uniref:(Fe-S)-binding protein n=1 Tax=Nocardioides terrisoli TaxID=3388267 RepID=UPI00287BBF94|nr:heterodisulfide reductase-related iron-sulfur binding cluster [Nocardioides marmorisolisilvae]